MQRIRALIDTHANLNAKDNDGDTELMCAAMKGYTEIVNILIAAHVDVNVQNCGFTALMYAATRGYTEIVKALIRATIAADKATNEAQATNANTEVNSLNIQNKNSYGGTVLHNLVCYVSSYSPVSTSSFTPNAAEAAHNRTCARIFASINSLISMMLNEGGANPLIKDKFGDTPIDLARGFAIYDQLPAFADYFRKKKQLVIGDHLAMGDRYMIDDVADIVGDF